MKDYRNRTVHALSWAFGSQLLTQIISFFFTIYLARLLVPDDFGLLAMTMVFVGFGGLLSNLGLGAALVQRKDVNEKHFCSVFWLNMLLGLLLAVAVFMLSSSIASFYDRPEIETIAKLLAITFIIGPLSSVPRTRLIKDLKYKFQSIADSTAMLISGIVAIYLASNNYGYYALVVHVLLRQIISTVLIWMAGRWYPKSGISIAALKELFGFSSAVFGSSLLRFIAQNTGNLILGKMLSASAVGIYDKAFGIMLFPLQNVTHVVSGVMFPSLSLIQDDKERVKNVYLRTISSIAFITFPMMIGLYIVAEPFTNVLLGKHWSEMVPIAQILCVAGLVISITSVNSALYRSQAAHFLEMKIVAITVLIRVIGILVGINWGLLGVAFGFLITTYINAVIGLLFAGRLVGVTLFEIVIKLAPILAASLLMALLLNASSYLIQLENETTLFISQIIFGIFFYIGIAALLRLEVAFDILSVLKQQYKK